MKDLLVKQEESVFDLGKVFFESGMFTDLKSSAQASIKILAGREIGLPAFASISGIHIIQGKPTLGAGLIASAVKGSGKYDYRVVEMNEKICSIDFFQGTESIGNSKFTIEDAKKALTKNIDKFPKNMLFARAISNGVKWFCPDVFSGPVYVPEEMHDVTHDVQHIEVIEPTIVMIPTLTETQYQTAINSNVKGITATLNAIEKGKITATSQQTLLLQEKLIELNTK